MGSPNYFGRWKENWDYLITQLTSAIAPGQMLQGIATVTRSEFPAIELLPAIGCQFKKSSWTIYGMGQRHVTQLFSVTCTVQQDQSDSVPDTGSAALATLTGFVNDGAGNGLEPFLNSLGPLSGQWVRSQITDLEMEIIPGETVNATAIAIARFVFETVDQVRGGG